MNKLDGAQRGMDLILLSAFKKAVRKAVAQDVALTSGNTVPRIEKGQNPVDSKTTIVQRLVEGVSCFNNKVNEYRLYVVFNLLVAENGFLNKEANKVIKDIRLVCKLWQNVIDSHFLQERFVVKLVNLKSIFQEKSDLINNILECEKMIVYQIFQYLSPKRVLFVCKQINAIIGNMLNNPGYPKFQDAKTVDLEWDDYVRSKFALDKNLKIEINLSKNEAAISELLGLIERGDACLKNVEAISFGKIIKGNVELVQKLLHSIFEHEGTLFLSFKKFVFGTIKRELIFPEFQKLETLIFKNIWTTIKLANFPALKKIECELNCGIPSLYELKLALKLRGLSEIRFCSKFFYDNLRAWEGLMKYFGKKTNLECIETIVIDFIGKDDVVDLLINSIYKHQEKFSGLKTIKIDNSACKFNNLPKFREGIEVVLFSGKGIEKKSEFRNQITHSINICDQISYEIFKK